MSEYEYKLAPDVNRPMRLNNFAHLWLHEGSIDAGEYGPHSIVLIEPISGAEGLSPRMRPYCHGLGEIDFYDKDGNGPPVRCRTHHLLTSVNDHVLVNGRWWEVCGGRCVYQGGRWVMRWRCYDNNRTCRKLNTMDLHADRRGRDHKPIRRAIARCLRNLADRLSYGPKRSVKAGHQTQNRGT